MSATVTTAVPATDAADVAEPADPGIIAPAGVAQTGAMQAGPPGCPADDDLDRPGASLLAKVLVLPIRGYQLFISPALPPTCRYYPSCSTFAIQALRRHGAIKGLWFAVRRIGRCHPWHWGGYDPVPPRGAGWFYSPARNAAAIRAERERADAADSSSYVPSTAGSTAA